MKKYKVKNFNFFNYLFLPKMKAKNNPEHYPIEKQGWWWFFYIMTIDMFVLSFTDALDSLGLVVLPLNEANFDKQDMFIGESFVSIISLLGFLLLRFNMPEKWGFYSKTNKYGHHTLPLWG
jgi:hypothetical protein